MNEHEDGTIDVHVLDKEYKKNPNITNLSTNSLPPPFTTFPLQNVDVKENGVSDMTQLNYLHEPSILDNLFRRFKADLPYTYTGDICIAVNPYQWLDIYGKIVMEAHINHFRHEIHPHVYATSSSAYRGVRDYSENQSILVSGESGAGKTETVKILMNHIAFIGGRANDRTIDKVLKANPLLESFGNAKTTRNDNSSRFGKFTQLQLDEFSYLVGSKCVTYLLEKSRVVSQNENERNYHIFHEIFAAPSEIRKKLKINDLKPSQFAYMNKGDIITDTIEGTTDSDRFNLTEETLALLEVSQQNIQNIFEILAGILHLGQITFVGKDGNNDIAMIAPSSHKSVDIVCELFQIRVEDFAEKIVIRQIEVVGDSMEVPLTVEQASDGKDALAKEIYARLFLWLVGVINVSTTSYNMVDKTIALLDIFGFESFQSNKFEQLCINYANEKLQQKFTQDVFLTVQHEYQSEGLQWEKIVYKDNVNVLELIEGRGSKALGIMAILNEECLMPRGTDANLLGKLRKIFDKNECFSFDTKGGYNARNEFAIRHYAGKVSYDINGFVDRNKDTLADETRLMMMDSDNRILADVFKHVSYSSETADAHGLNTMADKRSPLKAKGNRTSIGTKQGFLKAETIVTKFKGQLNTLMESIGQTTVQYVRCIKPNSVKSKDVFVRKMVVEQLRCAGMIEAIRITRAAYPYRVSQFEFIKRFSGLRTKAWNRANCGTSERMHCENLLVDLTEGKNGTEKTFEVGKTKVYFSSSILEFLEKERSLLLYKKIVMIQSTFRSFVMYSWYCECKRAAIYIESIFRMFLSKWRFLKFKNAIISMQCATRMCIAKRTMKGKKYLHKIVKIQSCTRMMLCKLIYQKKRICATKLSAWIKMIIEAKRYQNNCVHRKKQTRLTNKVDKLRKKLKSECESSVMSEHPVSYAEDDSMLAMLQEEMKLLERENEKLYHENSQLKESGRCEKNSLDSKIAAVAVGKATIQNLENEIDVLRQKTDKVHAQIKRFKSEKGHVVAQLLSMSNEVDTAVLEKKKYKMLYYVEKDIRRCQIAREREIVKRVKTLLRNRNVDYDVLTKKRMCALVHMPSTDRFSKQMYEKNKYRIHADSSDEEDIGSPRKNTLSRGLMEPYEGSINPGNESEKSDVSSMISSVSNDPNSARKAGKYRGRKKGKRRGDSRQHLGRQKEGTEKITPPKPVSWWNSFFG